MSCPLATLNRPPPRNAHTHRTITPLELIEIQKEATAPQAKTVAGMEGRLGPYKKDAKSLNNSYISCAPIRGDTGILPSGDHSMKLSLAQTPLE